jgi:hypothetical protein
VGWRQRGSKASEKNNKKGSKNRVEHGGPLMTALGCLWLNSRGQ